MDLIKINMCFAFLYILILSTILPANGDALMSSPAPVRYKYGFCPKRSNEDCSTPGTPCTVDFDCEGDLKCCTTNCNDRRCVYAGYMEQCPYYDAQRYCGSSHCFSESDCWYGAVCCATFGCDKPCFFNGEDVSSMVSAPPSWYTTTVRPSPSHYGICPKRTIEDCSTLGTPCRGDFDCAYNLSCCKTRCNDARCIYARYLTECPYADAPHWCNLDERGFLCCANSNCTGFCLINGEEDPRLPPPPAILCSQVFSLACPYNGYCASPPTRCSCYRDSDCQQGLTCCRSRDCYSTQCVDTSVSTIPTTTTSTQLPSTSSTVVETTTAKIAPTTGGTKPGECPADRIGKKNHTDIDCRTDFNCEGKLKCCPKAGKVVCRLPDSVVPGSCPKVKHAKSGKLSKSTCDSDYECSSKKKKCCQTETGGFICQIIQ